MSTTSLEHPGTELSSRLWRLVARTGLVLLVLKLVYVLVELYYNDSLILLGSSPTVDLDSLDAFHMFGRNVAAIGATLLFGGMIYRRQFASIDIASVEPAERWRRLRKVAISAGVIYLTSLLLQTIAIHALVDFSDNKTALRAYYGAAAQKISLAGMSNEVGLGDADKFLDRSIGGPEIAISLLPLASLGTDYYVDRLSGDRDLMASAARLQVFGAQFRADMAAFRKVQRELFNAWSPLNDATRKIHTAISKARDKLVAPRKAAYADLLHSYVGYELKRRAYVYQRHHGSSWGDPTPASFAAEVGLPPTLGMNAFFANPKVLKKAGFTSNTDAPAPMDIARNAKMLREKVDQMSSQALKRIRAKEPAWFPSDIPIDIDFTNFVRQPSVSHMIKQRTHGQLDGDIIAAGARDFLRYTWIPRANAKIDGHVQDWMPRSTDDMDTKAMARVRDNALEAAYVMPLALSLSTIFLFANAWGLRQLVPWGSRRKRTIVGVAITLVLVSFAFRPLLSSVDDASSFDLPIVVKQIARVSQVLQPAGRALTALVPPQLVGLLPRATCKEFSTIYDVGQPDGIVPCFYTKIDPRFSK